MKLMKLCVMRVCDGWCLEQLVRDVIRLLGRMLCTGDLTCTGIYWLLVCTVSVGLRFALHGMWSLLLVWGLYLVVLGLLCSLRGSSLRRLGVLSWLIRLLLLWRRSCLSVSLVYRNR